MTELGNTNPAERREEGKSYYFLTADPAFLDRYQEAVDYAGALYNALR